MEFVKCNKCKKIVPISSAFCSKCGQTISPHSVENILVEKGQIDRNGSTNNYPAFSPVPVKNPIIIGLKVVLLIFTCSLFVFIWNIESSKPVYKPSAADLEDAKILKEKQDKEAFYKYLEEENKKEIDRRLYGTK